jgi:hypothetical protein
VGGAIKWRSKGPVAENQDANSAFILFSFLFQFGKYSFLGISNKKCSDFEMFMRTLLNPLK